MLRNSNNAQSISVIRRLHSLTRWYVQWRFSAFVAISERLDLANDAQDAHYPCRCRDRRLDQNNRVPEGVTEEPNSVARSGAGSPSASLGALAKQGRLRLRQSIRFANQWAALRMKIRQNDRWG
jgi:hypothetical protein